MTSSTLSAEAELDAPTAVVLAAGLGSRLASSEPGRDAPKPAREVRGRTLLGRTLHALRAGGVARAVVVVGHRADEVEAAARAGLPEGMALETVRNDRYRLANGLSVLAARSAVRRDFVLVMSDHLLDAEIVALALAARPGDGLVLCVDRKLDRILDMEDATKVALEGDRIVRIGKDLEPFDAVDTGVFHCSSALFAAIERIDRARGDCSLSEGVAALAAAGKARVADIGALEWQDVDNARDLESAERMVARWGEGK